MSNNVYPPETIMSAFDIKYEDDRETAIFIIKQIPDYKKLLIIADEILDHKPSASAKVSEYMKKTNASFQVVRNILVLIIILKAKTNTF